MALRHGRINLQKGHTKNNAFSIELLWDMTVPQHDMQVWTHLVVGEWLVPKLGSSCSLYRLTSCLKAQRHILQVASCYCMFD